VPIDESLGALDDLVRVGKVRYIGCSNFLAYRLARALGRSETLGSARFDSVQPRYNLLFRQFERDLLPLCEEEGLAVIPYNPLAGGLLTGKHKRCRSPRHLRASRSGAARTYQDRYWHDNVFDTVDELVKLASDADAAADRRGRGVLRHPAITSPIVGASRPSIDATSPRSTPCSTMTSSRGSTR
jgi:aryl-alcohol dehydrogenase (NADP+)